VNTELVYHCGLGSPATYIYRHALIQDTAYQSLLKNKRQQYHQQIAQVLEARFAETVVTQPELVAHHYSDASLISQVIPYWQQAGQRAAQRSANAEAASHFTTALEPRQTLPDRPECNQHELSLDVTLRVSIMATKGSAAPEVGNIYRRARELCEQVGDTPETFTTLYGMWAFSLVGAGHELGKQLLRFAQSQQDPGLVVVAHQALGNVLFLLGETASARTHLEHGAGLYDSPQPGQVRIGIHTGPVVVGQMGDGSRHEQLALGETPNIAARVQGKAAPDTVVMSWATYRLVDGLFECKILGPRTSKGSRLHSRCIKSEARVRSRVGLRCLFG